jgi:hypothetical protein
VAHLSHPLVVRQKFSAPLFSYTGEMKAAAWHLGFSGFSQSDKRKERKGKLQGDVITYLLGYNARHRRAMVSLCTISHGNYLHFKFK